MYNIGNLILNGTMVVTTFWIVNRFLGSVYEKRQGNVWSILVWIVYGIFQVYTQINVGDASVITTLVSIILVTLISITTYYGFSKFNILIIVLFHAAWALVEMIVFFCMNLILAENIDTDILGTIISKIIMVVSVYIFSLFWQKRNYGLIPLKYYILLLLVPIGSIYIASEEFFSKSDTIQIMPSMITFSFLLLFNIIIWEIYSKVSQNFILEKEKAVYTQQINMMATNTEEQKRIMENFRREKHDWINKLIVLKNELQSENRELAIQEIDKIIQNSQMGQIISDTGNKCIDALINVKYTVARGKEIEFILKIFIPEELPIDQCDIGVVLGNLLDNAIEATEKCNKSERKIKIIMGIKKEALVMAIENPFEHQLQADKNGNLLSTKGDITKHGYGISSIKKVVEKYNGDVIIDTEDSIFSVTVTMNLKEF